MDKQPSEKRFALLIDADNVSAKYIKPITDELSNYGTVTIKRIYGDWTLSLHAKWKDALLENSLTPIQQFGYTQGKNATDSAMIIDAMDILYTGSVDGFCIVSSDSDFTRLASRLRESGRMVIGMGEKKTPTPFRRACDVFTTLELLLDDANGKRKGKGAGSGPSIEEVEQAVVRIITDNQNNGKATGLGEVGSRLLKRFPDFDVRSYGTNLLSKLLGKFASVTITKRGSDVSVELVDDKEQSKEAPREADASASDGKADKAGKTEKAEKAEKLEKAEKAGEPAEESSDAEAKSEEDAAQAEDGTDSSSRRRRRRRGGTRASRRRSAAESAESTVLEDGDAPSEPEEAGEILEEHIAEPQQGEKAEEGAPEQETSQQKAAEQKASQQDTSKQEASEVDASQSADETPRPKAQKPKRKTRRGAKKDDGASHESASAKAGKHASAEDAKSGSSEGAGPASAKGAKHDSGKGAKPSSGKNAKPGSDKAGKSASAEAAKPASELAEVDATTRRLVAEAGAAGIEMSQLASLVRAAHRGFKVRDHGHAQFKSYVASLGDIEIERIGKEWFARMGE